MKYVYVIAGLICLALGGAGAILPLLPTTPFVLLAAVCFGKSSRRLHLWFISTNLYKNNIEGFVNERTMTIKAKMKLLFTITVVMGFSIFSMHIAGAPLPPQILLGVVWALHVLYFGVWVKTSR